MTIHLDPASMAAGAVLLIFALLPTHVTPALWWGTSAALDLAWEAAFGPERSDVQP